MALLRKAITPQGAGPNDTVITSAVPTGWQYSALYVDGEAGRPFRITGFGIRELVSPALLISGSNQSWRIDNCRAEPAAGASIEDERDLCLGGVRPRLTGPPTRLRRTLSPPAPCAMVPAR